MMEVYERIRVLRKEHLKLSMEDFGKRLGVSRDVINNIEHNRLARMDQKLSLIKLMCAEFSVNEDWILNGIEPMFIQTPTGIMDQLKKEFSLDEFSSSFVYEYLKLDEGKRDAVREFFYNVLKGMDETEAPDRLFGEVPKTPEELEKEFPPVDAEDRKTGSDVG